MVEWAFEGVLVVNYCSNVLYHLMSEEEYDDLKPLARKTHRGISYRQIRQTKPGDFTEYLWKLKISGL